MANELFICILSIRLHTHTHPTLSWAWNKPQRAFSAKREACVVRLQIESTGRKHIYSFTIKKTHSEQTNCTSCWVVLCDTRGKYILGTQGKEGIIISCLCLRRWSGQAPGFTGVFIVMKILGGGDGGMVIRCSWTVFYSQFKCGSYWRVVSEVRRVSLLKIDSRVL